nr:MAG TPA_asm: hypothetical protein [Bacteriophage sp.]DAM37530.1 MAG TPA: hypothetical protein [Crassvirales sp.]
MFKHDYKNYCNHAFYVYNSVYICNVIDYFKLIH